MASQRPQGRHLSECRCSPPDKGLIGAPSAWDITAGAVTPFALMNDRDLKVRVVFDEGMRGDPLNFHPLRNDKTMAIALADLMRFVADTGHEVRVMELPQRTP